MSETTEVTVEFGCCSPCRLVAHKCNKLRFPSLQITVEEGGDGGRRTYYKRCKMLLHAQENGAWTNLDRLGPRHYQITLLDPIF